MKIPVPTILAFAFAVHDIGTGPLKIASWQRDISHGKFMGPRILNASTRGIDRELPGGDTSPPIMAPGLSLHHELASLVARAGLTPAEVIGRATIRSAAFHGRGDLGSIQVGKIADIVVLGATHFPASTRPKTSTPSSTGVRPCRARTSTGC